MIKDLKEVRNRAQVYNSPTGEHASNVQGQGDRNRMSKTDRGR